MKNQPPDSPTQLLSKGQKIQVRGMIWFYIAIAATGLGTAAKFYVDYLFGSATSEIKESKVEAEKIVSDINECYRQAVLRIEQDKIKEKLPLVGILTDFGSGSYYLGNFRGKVMNSHPDAKIIDISNEIKPFDTAEGAWVLYNASKTFPEGSIFLAIVNPGADLRNSYVIETNNPRYFFIGVGPGLFDHVTSRFGLAGAYRVQIMDDDDTFGTKVFSQIIGALFKNPSIEGLKKQNLISDKIKYEPILKSCNNVAVNSTQNIVKGYICSSDRWGNLLTNIKPELLKQGKTYTVKIGDLQLNGVIYAKSYSDGESKPGVLIRQDGWI